MYQVQCIAYPHVIDFNEVLSDIVGQLHVGHMMRHTRHKQPGLALLVPQELLEIQGSDIHATRGPLL